jgi:replicative DNA helicase
MTTTPTMEDRKPRRRQVSAPDRLPPHDVPAEQAVIAAIFLSPKDSMAQCGERGITPAAFYDLRHQVIYEVMAEMDKDGEAIDQVTVRNRLVDRQQLDEIGGMSYLVELPDLVASAANIEFHINIVKEKHYLRTMIHECTEIVTSAYGDTDKEPEQIILEGLARLQNLTGQQGGQRPIKDIVAAAIGFAEERFTNQGQLVGLSTGLIDLDKLTGGLCAPDVWILAARPSMGKSSLAMGIADHIAVDLNVPVGLFSLEMSDISVVLRLLAARARVSLRNIREGYFSERDFPKLTMAAGKLSRAPLHIDETPGLTLPQLRGKLRRMVQQHGIKLFVLDYMQLMSGGGRFDNRNAELTFISNGVKNLAKELNMPAIVVAQLSRDVEKQGNRKPRMSDIRECGAIEQDADFIGLLYKPEREDDGREHDTMPVDLLIAKQRNGQRDVTVHLMFRPELTKFESAAKISPEDVPHE